MLIVTLEKLLLLLLLMICVVLFPVKVTLHSPIEIAEPVENSQLPETSILPAKEPDMEAVEPQVTLTATSLPVLPMTPPMLNTPLMVALPEAVSSALLLVVAVMDNEAPELIVRFLHTGVIVPLTTGWFAGADGMITSSVGDGTPDGDQFVTVFQAVLVAPVQVFWAKMIDPEKVSSAMLIMIRIVFMCVLLENYLLAGF